MHLGQGRRYATSRHDELLCGGGQLNGRGRQWDRQVGYDLLAGVAIT